MNKLRNDLFFKKTVIINLVLTGTIILLVMSFAIYKSIKVTDTNMTSAISTVSNILANENDIKKSLIQGHMDENIKKYLNELIQTTEYIDIITIADTNSIRIYHKDTEQIGKKFQGNDEHLFNDTTTSYVTTGEGSLGKQRRAFTQIFDEENNPIGFVMVSTLTSHISNEYQLIVLNLIPLFTLLVVIAIGLAIFAAYDVRKSLLGHNPSEFVRLFIQRNEIFDALEEGILAIDKNHRILFVNQAAESMYHRSAKDLQGYLIEDVLPDCQLQRVLTTKEAEYNREMQIFDETILCDRIPMTEKGKISGALCIYRNKTEMTQMAEELTGVNHIIEALRSNMHEFKNHLHIILGMLQLEEYQLAEQYINGLGMNSMMISAVVKYIENKTLAALIYGKIGLAREAGITMSVDSNSYLPSHNRYLTTNQLVTILGNLLQNSIEATKGKDGVKEIILFITCDEQHLKIVVDDNGCGITQENLDQITKRGFSTKGENRGIGMSLIHAIVQDCNGMMVIDSEPGEGTSITIEFH
ncbi:Two-component sensor histidine kinase, malate [Lachnospiraceae bacterium TWA4]|nr:Two-component sensor histidine kinase, malate [Lachnospiraceae bacterium TWA4]